MAIKTWQHLRNYLLSTVFTLILVLGLLPGHAFASDGVCNA